MEKPKVELTQAVPVSRTGIGLNFGLWALIFRENPIIEIDNESFLG